MDSVNDLVKEIDWKALQKFLLKRHRRAKWNKILYRPDQCKYWFCKICIDKTAHEPLLGQSWKTVSCEGVCEEFVLR